MTATPRSAIATPPALMTGPELRAWREHWLLTQAQLARWLGIHTNTYNRWENGLRDIPRYLRPALASLELDLAAELRARANGLPTATP